MIRKSNTRFSRSDYLLAAHSILRVQDEGGVQLRVGERRTLAVFGKHLEEKALADVMPVVKLGTIRDSAGSL